jgi:4-carboxymuconolactone decarboxylase
MTKFLRDRVKAPMSELTNRGLNLFAEIRGAERAAALREATSSGSFGSALMALSADFVFGSVWARDGLERKQRSLVTIGILIALRQIDELKSHIRIGVTNGLTVREIEEALLQAAVYAGFPAAHVASNAVIEVLRDLGLEPRSGGLNEYRA